ncbi:MAG TPA: ATP-grasp domain-containing protein [Jatrophihabitans sp.]|nr:ATP-grasp domain-containing protein [Jatrophihabitans sp.]
MKALSGNGSDRRQSHVLIIEPSSSGTQLIAAVSRLGHRALVLSHNDADRTVPPAELARWGAELVVVDTNDLAAVLACASRLAEQRDIVGVLPGFEYYVPTAALLAAEFGLPGLAPEICLRVRDKLQMRQALAAAGIAGPVFRPVAGRDELAAVAGQVGFPLVLKPTQSAGSIHVTLVHSLAELRAAYDAIVTDATLDFGVSLGPEALVEEFVAGPEFSVEGYVRNGRTVVVSITEKLVSEPPGFIELGHTVPAALDAGCRCVIRDWTAEVVRALGVDCTVFHLELRLRDGVPYVIEFGARLAGDAIPLLIELSTGVDLADIFVRLATDRPIEDITALPTDSARQVAAIRFFYEPGLEVISSAPAPAELHALPAVISGEVTAGPGDRPNCWLDSRSRLGWVMMTGADRPSVDRSWNAVRRTVRFT